MTSISHLFENRTDEVTRQNRLMHIVNDAAALLLSSGAEEYADALAQGMEMIGRHVGVDRVSVWQNHRLDDGLLYYKTVCQWASEGVILLDLDKLFSYKEIVPHWESIFSRGEIINCPVDNLDEPERSALEAFSMKSILAIPIFVKGHLWGFVSLDDYKKRRVFPAAELDILRSWGLLIVGAIQRQEIALNMQDTLNKMVELQYELKKALEDAKAASRAKSAFLANMSHEIRTPMNAVIGMTSIGITSDDSEKKNYCFTKIDEASKHLLGVINDILDMSKIEANKFELTPVEFNFEKMLQRVVNVVNFRVDEKHQNLTVHIDPAIPEYIFADDLRLTQVITNLAGNAVKFTPPQGNITIDTRLLEDEDGLCTIEISVTDTGIGISAGQQSRLFQSFQQAESETSRKFGGTGLGLSISKSIVEMMNGKIRVESVLNKGSTFAFTIKARRGTGKKHRTEEQESNWEGIRILIVDDDMSILEFIRDICLKRGADCDIAWCADEALEFIKEGSSYDICFVDWRLPDMDGITLTRKIKDSIPSPDGTKIIMTTAADWNSIEKEATEAGAAGFLPKPLFPSSIIELVNDYFSPEEPQPEIIEESITGIFAGHRILLVDDVEINREIVIALLEPTLLEIDCAENGKEAYEKFSEAPGKYEMIFMDLQMPEMDGYEATIKIRAYEAEHRPDAPKIPIIAMTANVFREDVEKCLSVGMDSHIGKPLDFSEVLDKLQTFLQK